MARELAISVLVAACGSSPKAVDTPVDKGGTTADATTPAFRVDVAEPDACKRGQPCQAVLRGALDPHPRCLELEAHRATTGFDPA